MSTHQITPMRTHRAAHPALIKGTIFPLFSYLLSNLSLTLYPPKSKGKGKVYGPLTRASPRLAALRAQVAARNAPEAPITPASFAPPNLGRKPRMRVKYFTERRILAERDPSAYTVSSSANPMDISSELEEEEDLEEEKEEENTEDKSEEAPEYIPGAESIEEEEVLNYVPGEGAEVEEEEESEEDLEEDPKEDPEEEPVEDPEEDPK
ncbi:hypothetical protein PIB30_017021 [Stylosanthes scabra]|uniref:Uncharacterized protein n=1 Tax=Stylosanthes scabra TaxID=79078 RepID=A0ABU6Q7C9_9FABA|nr:hypothetical protein [Stylosanthes scabra]